MQGISRQNFILLQLCSLFKKTKDCVSHTRELICPACTSKHLWRIA